MCSDGADMFGIQERFFTARVENGGSSQNIKVVIDRRSNSNSILSIVAKKTSIFRVSRGQRVAELFARLMMTKNVSSLELVSL